MILYIPGRRKPLSDFGIEIPSGPGKVGQVLTALRENPAIGPQENRWLLGYDGSEITREDLLLVHAKDYIDKLYSDGLEEILVQVYELIDSEGNYHRYNPAKATRPLSEMFDGNLKGIGGGYQCCKKALADGFCFYFGGGAHHAHYDFGHGFCILNDILLPLKKLQAEQRIGTAWVIDVDVHKGDGTAAITKDDATVVTLSAHMASGWPLDEPSVLSDGRPNPAFIPSDVDIPIESGEEDQYVSRLEAALQKMLKQFPRPDLALVVLGADPYEHDALPSTAPMKLTLEQMSRRDLLIYHFLESHSIPGAYYMAGGYGPRAWEPYPPFLEYVIKKRLKPRV